MHDVFVVNNENKQQFIYIIVMSRQKSAR